MTSDAPWDPKCLDDEFHESDYADAIANIGDEVTIRRDNRNARVDEHGFVIHQNFYEVLQPYDTDSDEESSEGKTEHDLVDLPELFDRDVTSVYTASVCEDDDSIGTLRHGDDFSIGSTEIDFAAFYWDTFEEEYQPFFDAREFQPGEENSAMNLGETTHVISNHPVPSGSDDVTSAEPATATNENSWFIKTVNKLVRWAFPQKITRKFTDLDILKPNFGWANEERIKSTLDKTTQFYRATPYTPFRKHYKSRFPAANVRRLN